MALPRELQLTTEQIDDIMAAEWNMRVATHGPGSRINLTPMWFGWGGGKVFFYARGQKVVNLRRDPHCTIMVDRNERFPELQGIMLQGVAVVLEDAAAELAEPDLQVVRVQMGKKYNGGHGPVVDDPPANAASAGGRNRRWVVLKPDRIVSWDNFKLS